MSKRSPHGVQPPVVPLLSTLDRVLDSRASVRAWLVDGGSPNALSVEGEPAWAQVLTHAPADAMDELINAGADLNQRDALGRGWLLRCLDNPKPVETWLVLQGLRRLNRDWWKPDDAHRSPFHDARLSVSVAQAMGTRWWTEGHRWADLTVNAQTPADSAQAAGRADLARVWHTWGGRSLFARRRQDVHRSPPSFTTSTS